MISWAYNWFEMVNSSSLSSGCKFFQNLIADKLHDPNYLHWKQVEVIIKSHKLQRFVVTTVIPPRFLSDNDCAFRTINPAYEEWEVQDQILLSCLQLTLSKTICPTFLELF